ncbi:MAG: transcriptional regulator [Verrucomicrobia bacterium]|nr:MAG: transcriptional regulator [Verrucomicrobiota bacterium]
MLPNIEIVNWRNKHLIRIEVYSSPNIPHYLKKQGPENGVYVRLGSSNRQADQSIIQELKRIADRQAFDEMPQPKCSVKDIDFEAVQKLFSPKRKLIKKDLENLKIIDWYQKKLVPTVGGILLFGKNRDQMFPDAWIQYARFHGNEKKDLLDQLDIREHLPFAVDQAVDFLKKHALLEGKIEYIRREDRWNIPIEAIREGIINAIIHADYSLQGIAIKIAVFDDRIEISNPGLFVNGITAEDIHDGTSKIRNRVLARIFKEVGLIEQWGTGFLKIRESCEAYGLPNPIIEEKGGPSIRLTLFTQKKSTESILVDIELLNLFKGTECLSTKDLAAKLQLTPRAIRTRLNRLIKLGLLIPISRNINDPTKKYILSNTAEEQL